MSTPTPIRFVIVGGVAAGASAAARARRLSESAQITVIERGQDVSFANCGLPYFIGGEIASRAAGTINIPLGELRQRLGELDRTQPTVTVCAIGKTSYFASRILSQNGFPVRSFNGGIRANIDPRTPPKPPAPK